jgi:hypothetical protein
MARSNLAVALGASSVSARPR